MWLEIICYVLLASVILGKGILFSQSVTGYGFSFGVSGFSAYLLFFGIIAIMIIPIIYE
ncbi:hypothetical protein [Marinitoga sp. 38H-ov]|uniref:hypothetical protein n=1 Tax=Marinitoga sp. 38H-ov TaxID=1755814 RepID=UPI0013EC9699|nr:hypothetical protein [Marinitoga sp. 38H-ov]